MLYTSVIRSWYLFLSILKTLILTNILKVCVGHKALLSDGVKCKVGLYFNSSVISICDELYSFKVCLEIVADMA